MNWIKGTHNRYIAERIVDYFTIQPNEDRTLYTVVAHINNGEEKIPWTLTEPMPKEQAEKTLLSIIEKLERNKVG